jgi:medium-chain acyl-[acyl-carrier-protein] hydrolase
VRLICLPYAGGGQASYQRWRTTLEPDVEVVPVVLPGREMHVQLPLLTHYDDVLAYLWDVVLPRCRAPFALYGHSMGASMAFECARLLRNAGRDLPTVLLVSGARAPRFGPARPRLAHLPVDEFIEQLRRYGGTPEEVLAHAELLEYLLPLLRADFAVAESYTYRSGPPLPCPIGAYSGRKDSYSWDEVDAWREETTGSFWHEEFPGGHFFIRSQEEQFLALIRRELLGSRSTLNGTRGAGDPIR